MTGTDAIGYLINRTRDFRVFLKLNRITVLVPYQTSGGAAFYRRNEVGVM